MTERIHNLYPPFDWRIDPANGNLRLFVHGNPGFKNLINELQAGTDKKNVRTEVVESNITKMNEVYTVYDTILTEGGMIFSNGTIVPTEYFKNANCERLIQALNVNLLIVNKTALTDKKYGTSIRQDFNLAKQSSLAIVKPHLVERLEYWNLKTGTPFFQYLDLFESPKHLWPLEYFLMLVTFNKLEELKENDHYSMIGKETLHRQILTDIVFIKGLGRIHTSDTDTK